MQDRQATDTQQTQHRMPLTDTRQTQHLIAVALKPLVVAVKVGAAVIDHALLVVAAHAEPPGAERMAVAKRLLFALAEIAMLGVIAIELRAVMVDVALEAAIAAVAVVIVVGGSGLRQAKRQKSQSTDGQCEKTGVSSDTSQSISKR